MRNPFASSATARIDLSDGIWIEAKQELSYGDRRAIRQCFLKSAIDGSVNLNADGFEEANVRLMEVAIVDWSLELDGRKAEICRENIDRLDDVLAGQILSALDKQYRPIEKAKKKA